MTHEELKALVGENSLAIQELRTGRLESERWWQESEQRWQESRQESERKWQESRRESQRLWEEILASRKESDRLITSFNRQLGQFGNKFGDYTEALFRPSLEQALREQFGMTEVISRLQIRRTDETFEFDMVAHAGDESDKVYLVEIKSHLREDGIIQMLDQLRQFPRLFPEHRGKKLFGILAALDIPEAVRSRAQSEGLYLATIKDDVFEIGPPGDGFEPRALVRPHVASQDLAAAYRDMAADEEREAEAHEWAEATARDVADEAR
jgi:hypothetical protein